MATARHRLARAHPLPVVRIVAVIMMLAAVAFSAAAAAPARRQVLPSSFGSADAAKVAVSTAMAQVGLPYVWGGDDPAEGFDCSGLTRFAYSAAGIDLPRTADSQFREGPPVPASAPLRSGDLVFYGSAERVRHVGLYVGGGRMVTAPHRGEPVQVVSHRWPGDDYVGATRPASRPDPR
jgi:cell wall-associated NlpC family hydrolase